MSSKSSTPEETAKMLDRAAYLFLILAPFNVALTWFLMGELHTLLIGGFIVFIAMGFFSIKHAAARLRRESEG